MTTNKNATFSAQHYANMASTIASSPEAVEAGYAVRQTAKDIEEEFKQGEDWSLHVMSLLAGLAMMLVSVNVFLAKIVMVQWYSAILDFVIFLVGMGVVLIESGAINLSLCRCVNTFMYRHVPPFLLSFSGRGMVMTGTGLVEILFLKGLLDIIVGLLAIYAGIMLLWMGYRSTQKLRTATIGLDRLQEQFALADADGKGSLTLKQFRQLVANLGLELNKRESEAAFMQMEQTHTGRLTYESIHAWWAVQVGLQ